MLWDRSNPSFHILSLSKCQVCTSVVCDDFISCPKCKKSYHWDCSDLTKFEIKLHKNNPYKPWRCNPCKDKYCKQCDKVFSENNYESFEQVGVREIRASRNHALNRRQWARKDLGAR